MHTSLLIYIFLLHHYASLYITCLHYMHLACHCLEMRVSQITQTR